MITGTNSVEVYSEVEGYSLDPQNSRTISGGGSGTETIVGGVRFFWVYDPDGQSGFTGWGWFDGPNSPLGAANLTGELVEQQFAQGQRSDLNDIFDAWEIFINKQENPSQIINEFVNQLIRAGSMAGQCFSYETTIG